ncbi:hypothetical protein M3Y97_01125800 [Aphelenchoides bicaudatus]|nr:hypothetical protein M3Y97_01125800 [Aphelenchoides bicaudatus]
MYHEILITAIVSITTFSCLVAVPLYILVLIVIATHRHVEPFNSEFFIIFFGLGVVDVVCYLLFLTKKIFFLGYVPSFFLPYNQPNVYATYYYYPFWVFAFLQYQLTLILTLNRFVSIVWPSYYNLNWTVTKTQTIILTSICICLALASPVLFSECQLHEYTVTMENITRTYHNGPAMMTAKTAQF